MKCSSSLYGDRAVRVLRRFFCGKVLVGWNISSPTWWLWNVWTITTGNRRLLCSWVIRYIKRKELNQTLSVYLGWKKKNVSWLPTLNEVLRQVLKMYSWNGVSYAEDKSKKVSNSVRHRRLKREDNTVYVYKNKSQFGENTNQIEDTFCFWMRQILFTILERVKIYSVMVPQMLTMLTSFCFFVF